MSEDNVIIATALLGKHNQWLDAKGLDTSRYSRALSHLIADQVRRQRDTALRTVLLVRIAERAKQNEQAIIDSIDDDAILSPDDQRKLYEKIMKCRSIAERATEALNGNANSI